MEGKACSQLSEKLQVLRDGEMSQWTSHLLCKPADLDSKMHIKVIYNSTCTSNSRKIKEEIQKPMGQLSWYMQLW